MRIRPLLITAAAATAAFATPSQAQVIMGYDLENAEISGFEGWKHSYNGSIVSDGTGYDYTGGGGTLNDGLQGTGSTTNHLFMVDDFQITAHLDGYYNLSSISLLSDYVGRNTLPASLTGVNVTIGGVTQFTSLTKFGTVDLFGSLSPTLSNISTNQFTLSGFTGGQRGLGSIGELTVAGRQLSVLSAVPEPGTWAMMLIGFGGIGYAMRRRRKAVPLPRFA